VVTANGGDVADAVEACVVGTVGACVDGAVVAGAMVV